MTLLILGLILWVGAHFFKRLMPEQRARMDDAGKGIVALLVVASLILIIIGYRWADFIPVWSPPEFFKHLVGPIMLLAFWIYGSSAAKGAKAWPAYKLRHPQLLAVKIWAAAHLLANGDLASILLFGTMLVWAGVTVMLVNRAEPHWVAPAPAGQKTYIRLSIITLLLFTIVVAIHTYLGVPPFGG